MNRMSRFATVTVATALTAGALLVPTAAHAAPILAEDAATATCTVLGGDLQWGVKESFRSYISGSIANGSWEVSDGTTYDTPYFGWSNATGEINAETGEGSISFIGTVRFSGHDDVLNTTLSNPTITLMGDGTARLLLDATSNDPQGVLMIDEQQATIAKLEGVDLGELAGGELSLVDVPAILTSEGAAAFGGFYSSGDELDPITLNVQLAPCAGAAASDAAEDQETVEVTSAPAPVEAEPGVPWLPIIIGGAALVVIGVAAGMLLAGRKQKPGAGADASADGTTSGD